jgi:hypothetical protein
MHFIPYASITMVISFTLAAVHVWQAFKARNTSKLQSTGVALVAFGFFLVFLIKTATLVLYECSGQTSDPWLGAMNVQAIGLVVQ